MRLRITAPSPPSGRSVTSGKEEPRFCADDIRVACSWQRDVPKHKRSYLRPSVHSRALLTIIMSSLFHYRPVHTCCRNGNFYPSGRLCCRFRRHNCLFLMQSCLFWQQTPSGCYGHEKISGASIKNRGLRHVVLIAKLMVNLVCRNFDLE